MTNVERAKNIRKSLKDELGYSNRMVKVTTEGRAINVIALTEAVDLKKVFTIVSQYKTDYNYVFVGEKYSIGITRIIPTCELH